MLLIILSFILSYIILITGFTIFLNKPSGYSDSLKISIITAVKNESRIIESFISSVKNLDYPQEKFELIVVDDNSTDNTYELVYELVKNQNNIRIIKTNKKSIYGKRSALIKGIENSQFSNIVITDADCVPSVDWLKTCAGQFEKGNEFIFGPAPYYNTDYFINKISSIENLKNQFLSFSLASLGLPYTASARNMGFKKEAFYKIGGYDHTIDSLSGDDDLLLREAIKNKLKISAFYSRNGMVFSYTVNNMNDYFNQRARHTQSSLYYLLRSKIILTIWHILNLFMLISLLLIFININFIWLFTTKMIFDSLLIMNIQKKFNYKFSLTEIFFNDILYEFFLIINFFSAIFKNITWK